MVNILGTNVSLRPAAVPAFMRIGGDRARASKLDLREHRLAMDALLTDPVLDPEILAVVADDGTPIYTEARGPKDGVPIVLSHGWSCSARFWNAQINELARDHRVVVYDQRGHGRTPSGISPPTVDRLGMDLAAVMRAATAGGQRAILVGHSMGGITVSSWAAQHAVLVAEQCRAVILASTATDRLLNDFGVLPFPTRLPGAAAIGKVALSAPLSVGLLPAQAFQYAVMGPNSTRAQIAFSRDIISSCPPRNRGRWGGALSGVDVRRGVGSISVPTTVIVGTKDRLTPPVHAQRMAAQLEKSGVLEDLLLLDGVGHMSAVEAPFEFNAEVRRLLAKTDS